MEKYSRILRIITILFYLFLILFAVNFSTDVVPSFAEGWKAGQESARTANGWEMLITAPASLGALVAMGFFVHLLISAIVSIHRRNIFTSSIVRRINRFAITLGASMILMFTSYLLFRMNNETVYEVISEYTASLMQITILLILGQVIRIGVKLKEEQELTV